ncbi:MAG TPA: DUF523 domain-containing protein [Clostridiaceae bacterium]|nr:DUF523 domain-containing protein [Clostridiaceae bacterium]
MNIIVSACLLGKNVKYNGGNNCHPPLIESLHGHRVIPICPEVAGGLPTPRPPVEISGEHIVTKDGHIFDSFFEAGRKETMAIIQAEMEISDIDLAILQSRSPSCGVNQIYDGTFSGTKIEGQGYFARHLQSIGVRVVDIEDFTPDLLK